MLDLLVPVVWTLSGVLVAAALADRSDPRWGWSPLAAILGPLWIAVALEQRSVARRGRGSRR